MRRLLPVLLLALLTACVGQPPRPNGIAAASQVVEIDDLARVAPAVADNGGRRTLLVLDIDDTLLTSAGFFGSDAWYEWQKTLPAGDPGKVACLFDVISLNYEAGAQQATQADGPALVNPLVQRDALMDLAQSAVPRRHAAHLRDAGYACHARRPRRRPHLRWRKAPEAKRRPELRPGVFMTTARTRPGLWTSAHLGLSYQRVCWSTMAKGTSRHSGPCATRARLPRLHYRRFASAWMRRRRAGPRGCRRGRFLGRCITAAGGHQAGQMRD